MRKNSLAQGGDTIMEEKATAWERVKAARDLDRPAAADYISHVFDGFMELRGDRFYGDDRAVIGGIASIGGRYVTVIGQQKGRSLKENKHRNFGMPNPEGYRKALRLMKQAEKFGRPILLFVDTPGAFCGVEAEERGQGEAIARNLFEMAGLKVPVLSIVIGEGGSGGALAMAMANQVWMLENSVYSILSPEGFAAILWKDGSRAAEAAEAMKITAAQLKELGVIEKVISEAEEVPGIQPSSENPRDETDEQALVVGRQDETDARIFVANQQKKSNEQGFAVKRQGEPNMRSSAANLHGVADRWAAIVNRQEESEEQAVSASRQDGSEEQAASASRQDISDTGRYCASRQDILDTGRCRASRHNMERLAQRIRAEILDFLKEYETKSPEEIVEERYRRFRQM